MSTKAILCISPTTNVESTWVIPGLHLGGVFRCEQVTHIASGKGINVCRAIGRIKGQALGMGFVAGQIGRFFAELAKQEGLRGVWIWVEGESRQALVLNDPQANGDATLLSGPGPRVDEEDWARLEAEALRQAEQSDYVCLSGSLPPGSPLDSFTHLISRLMQGGKQVWVDASDTVLEAALGANPTGVKVNAREAEALTGIVVNDVSSGRIALEHLLDRGAANVVITLGSDGALLGSADGCWYATAPKIPRFVSSVGSGDAFSAGLLVGLSRKLSIPECLRMASAAGGANVLKLGGGQFEFDDYDALIPTVEVSLLHGP